MEILPFSKEDLVDLLNHILCDRIVQAEPPMVLVYHSTVTSNQRTTEQRNSTSPHERILYVTVIKLEDLAVFIRDARRFALQPPWLISSKASMRVPMLTPFHLRFRTNELHQKIFQNQGDTKPVKETLKTAKEVNANALQRRLSRSSMNLHDFNEFHLRFVVGNSSLPPSSQSTPELRRQTPQPKRPDSRAEHFSEAAAAGAQYITLRDQWGQPEVVYAKKSWISSWERQKKAEQIAATGSSVIQQQRKTKKPTKGVQTDPSRTGDPNTLGLEKVAKKRLKSFGYFGIDHPVVIREGVEIDNKQKKSPL